MKELLMSFHLICVSSQLEPPRYHVDVDEAFNVKNTLNHCQYQSVLYHTVPNLFLYNVYTEGSY